MTAEHKAGEALEQSLHHWRCLRGSETEAGSGKVLQNPAAKPFAVLTTWSVTASTAQHKQ